MYQITISLDICSIGGIPSYHIWYISLENVERWKNASYHMEQGWEYEDDVANKEESDELPYVVNNFTVW